MFYIKVHECLFHNCFWGCIWIDFIINLYTFKINNNIFIFLSTNGGYDRFHNSNNQLVSADTKI
jgi:hypothetical protein